MAPHTANHCSATAVNMQLDVWVAVFIIDGLATSLCTSLAMASHVHSQQALLQ